MTVLDGFLFVCVGICAYLSLRVWLHLMKGPQRGGRGEEKRKQ